MMIYYYLLSLKHINVLNFAATFATFATFCSIVIT